MLDESQKIGGNFGGNPNYYFKNIIYFELIILILRLPLPKSRKGRHILRVTDFSCAGPAFREPVGMGLPGLRMGLHPGPNSKRSSRGAFDLTPSTGMR